jgi:hypothetical protein
MPARKDEAPQTNRARKVAGREKRRRFVQGTRAYTHAMTNSMARRTAGKTSAHEKSESSDSR